MTANTNREIVLEFEKIQLIRKRAKTQIQFCRECATRTDFVSLSQAAELFEAVPADLFHFIRTNKGHYNLQSDTRVDICLAPFLRLLKNKFKSSTTKLIGESK